MATGQGKTRIPLKLLVDEKRNRVVLADASKDFVDILLGFLTLPMGTVMRIIGNQKISEDGMMGGMQSLYESVKDLGDDNFSTEVRKASLLKPKNTCEKDFMNLKVEIDASWPKIFYSCSGPVCGLTTMSNLYMSASSPCRCGGYFSNKSYVSFSGRCGGDVFLKGGSMFIVSDDLQVMPFSTTSLVKLLNNLGISDLTQVKEISVEAGIEEISSLLKCSLISKSPLTDVFLVKQGKSKNLFMPEPRNNLPLSSSEAQKGTCTSPLSLKLVLRKSTNAILHAEASNDFVDFLFSFLTIPLGTVVSLLKGQTGFECIEKLHKSVASLESKWFRIGKDTLLNSGVAPEYDYWRHPLGFQTFKQTGVSAEKQICGGFMKLGNYLVTDALAVRDLSSVSCIDSLKGFNVPFHDIEERIVTVDETQALGILKASLTSFSALTNGLKLS